MSTAAPESPRITPLECAERMVSAFEDLDRIRVEERTAIDSRDELRLLVLIERKVARIRELELLRMIRAALRGA